MILQKQNKTSKEMDLLAKTFTGIPFFNEILDIMNFEVYTSLLRKVKFEEFSKGDIIFQKGEFS